MAEPSHNPYSRSPNLSTRSYDSSSVSSATSPRPPSRYLAGMLNTGSRHNASNPQPVGLPSLPSVSQAFPPYTPMTGNSVLGRESLASTDSMMSGHAPGSAHQPGTPGSQAQKRAYRQRRKDPSCDACRERKVKCDATETTSCSECSSRNVKCQFTKETNRRMSSIKQVQDLEKQIERVKRDNSNLRRMLEDRTGSMDVDGDLDDRPSADLPSMAPEPRQRKRSVPLPDLSRARGNVKSFAKGVWKPAAQHRPAAPATADVPNPELPPRAVADQLLRSYYSSAHTMFPILHLPTFQASVDDLYRSNQARPSPDWLSLFFAVLATGSLYSPEPPSTHTFYRPAELLESVRKTMDPWSNNHTLDNARALALISICLNEMNLKSAAWNWLGNAIRVSQDLGLYSDSGTWPVVEGELRRRTWWTLYVLDRTMATEQGHPFIIEDSDCSVSLPAPVDDLYIRDSGTSVPEGAEPLTHSLLAVIHVVRSYTALIKALDSPIISPSQLSTFDAHFRQCLGTFPPACDPASPVALASHFLAPLAYLLHARLLLHRHNLGPACPPDARLSAIENCTHVAVETASLLSRTRDPADGATALLTMHVFRSTLFLLLAGYLDHAVTCVQALGSIDARRDVAVPCGRYLALFVSTLAGKRSEHASYLSRNSPRTSVDQSALLMSLARDEELLVYVSTDAQASPDRSWLWTTPEHQPTPKPIAGPTSGGPRNALFSPDVRTGLTDDERREWGGWQRLETAIRGLSSPTTTWTPLPPPPPPQSQQHPHPHSHPHSNLKSESPSATAADIPRLSDAPRYAHDAPKFGAPRAGGSGAASAEINRDRLSIANII